MTAITHGLSEEVEELKNSLNSETPLPEVDPNAQILEPPQPIVQMEENWPLLTVSKGFFEGVRAVRGGAKGGKVAEGSLAMADMDDLGGDGEGGAWGDDDLGFDDDDDEFKDAKDEDGDEEGGGNAIFKFVIKNPAVF